jgi:hypothetical protein
MKQVPNWGPINIRHHRTEFILSVGLVLRIYAHLAYVYLAHQANTTRNLSFSGLIKIFYKGLRGRFTKRVGLLQDL